MDNINTYSRERGRVIEFQQILYGYYRVNPLYGPDYILDILLTYKKYRGRKMTVPVRRHAYLQQQFTSLEIREVLEGEEVLGPNAENGKSLEEALAEDTTKDSFRSSLAKISQNLPNLFIMSPPDELPVNNIVKDSSLVYQKLINFILPLSGRHDTFLRFMKTYEKVCLSNNENVALYIVLFSNNLDINVNDTLSAISEVQSRYPIAKIKLVPVFDKFARAKALDYGMTQVTNDDLLFFIDVDMIWTLDTLQRIRTNTIKGKMAYFPIVFSEFDPHIVYNRNASPNHFLINQDSGYWRQFGYGIVSMYKQDIKQAGGFDTSIHGWGKEDVEFFEKLLLSSANVSVLRSVDSSLVHIFHIVDCDPSLEESRLNMCRNTRTETFGGVNQLANIIYRNGKNVFQFAVLRNQQSNKPIR